MVEHCKICHRRTATHSRMGCALTHPMLVLKLYYHECPINPGVASLTIVEKGIDRIPFKIVAETRKERLAKCYQLFWNALRWAGRCNRPPHIEVVFNTWAILEMMPDEGVPCANIRPLDLIADKESLFSSCEVINLLKIEKPAGEKKSREIITITPLYNGEEEEKA